MTARKIQHEIDKNATNFILIDKKSHKLNKITLKIVVNQQVTK